MLERGSTSLALAVLVASSLIALAAPALGQEPVPMTPDVPGAVAPGGQQVWGPRPAQPTWSPSAGPRWAAPDGARPPGKQKTGLLFAGATMFLLGGVQVPIGVALLGANDGGPNVVGALMLVTGATACVVGVPLMIVGAGSDHRDDEVELALRVTPGGLSLGGTF